MQRFLLIGLCLLFLGLLASARLVSEATADSNEKQPTVATAQDDAETVSRADRASGVENGDDRREDERRRPRRGRTPELTEEQAEQHLRILERINPDLAQRIIATQESEPDRAHQMIQSFSARLGIGRLAALEENDPQMFELTVDNIRLTHATHELGRRYRRAVSEEEHDKAQAHKKELAKLVEEHFEVRQNIRERELQDLEERLKQMRQGLQQRRESRANLITDRVEQLTGQSQQRVEF